MNAIEELLKELLAIQQLGNSKTAKIEAIKKYSEAVFDAATDTFPMRNTPLYKDFNDYFKNN